MHEQLRAHRLLERRRERVDELVGQLADEADRVRQQVGAAAEPQGARRRVERVEQPVADAHVGARERVQQRRLAGVGVAHQRHRRRGRALALGALDRARALDVLEAPAQRCDAVARKAPVGLDLRLARAPRADAAAEPLEVAPQAAHAREVVFELRELDLQLALRATRVRGEDVEDHRRAVDDRQAERLLHVALLARRQLVVAGDQVRAARARELLALLQLAGAEVGVRVGLLAALDQLAHDRHARRSQELSELGEIVISALRQRRDAERPLACAAGRFRRPPRRPRPILAAIPMAVVAELHSPHSVGATAAPGCGLYGASLPRRSTASSSRSSGVVSEIRNQPSPAGPYTAPGVSTTAASSSTCSQ